MDNGLYTIKFSDERITGKVYDYFEESKPYSGRIISGKKVYIGNLLNGEKEGRWKSYYHSTGRKIIDVNYKNGKLDGLWISWYDNGQKKSEQTYKDGEEIFKKEWNEDGFVKE